MAVYYRYRSGVDTFSLPVPAASISVGELKRLILGTSRHGHGRTRGRGPREGIALTNAQTGEEYADDGESVPRNSTVVVRRLSGPPVETIVVESSPPSVLKATQDSCSPAMSSASAGDEDEEAKAISAVIDAAELKWEGPSQRPRCYDHRGATHSGRAPPVGYVCRRCRIPGHFIQHCPTNGDPKFDLRRATANPPVLAPAPMAPVTVIPDPDDGIPEDLHCKICKKVMSDAVLASKCCSSSFCDKCIRAHIAANSKCACGARARADDLIPNPTLRAMIASTLDMRGSSASSGTEKPKSSVSSNAVPTSQIPAAASQASHVSSEKGAASVSELHSDGSGSTMSKITRSPTTEQESTADKAKARPNSHADQYAHSVPSGPPVCYGPFFGGMDPRMYYGGGMPDAYGGGYPMPFAPPPHHVDAVGNVPASYGYHGRKRIAECEEQRHPDRGFKRRCSGSRSHVALILM